MGFFDKVKEGLEKGASTVSSKSKEMYDITKVKLEIDSLKRKKKDALSELGEAVYEMFMEDCFDQERLKEQCVAVTEAEKQVKEKEKELEEIQR